MDIEGFYQRCVAGDNGEWFNQISCLAIVDLKCLIKLNL